MPRYPLPAVLPALALQSLALLAFAPPTLAAQTPAREPAVVEVPGSTRAMALGHAYPLGDAEADVLFYNPALLDRAAGSVLGGVHLLGEEALGFSLVTARDAFGGAAALGLQVLQYASPGPGLRGGGLDPLVDPAGEGVSEVAATLGLSRRLLGFRVGVAAKVVDQRWSEFRRASASVDLGIARPLGPLVAGLAVRNLGPDRAVSPDGDVPQPRRITLGVGDYGRRLGPLDVGVAAAVTLRDDDEVVFGGGLEVGYWPVVGRTFVFRVGGRSVPEGDALPLTAGAAFWGDDLVLEYAWQDMGALDAVHRFGIGWR